MFAHDLHFLSPICVPSGWRSFRNFTAINLLENLREGFRFYRQKNSFVLELEGYQQKLTSSSTVVILIIAELFENDLAPARHWNHIVRTVTVAIHLATDWQALDGKCAVGQRLVLDPHGSLVLVFVYSEQFDRKAVHFLEGRIGEILKCDAFQGHVLLLIGYLEQLFGS